MGAGFARIPEVSRDVYRPHRFADSDSAGFSINGPHRYWRIYVTANDGGPFIGIEEMQFRASAGGSDLTTPAGAATAAAASTTVNGSNTPAMAFDDNSGTRWLSTNATPPQWLRYDFGSAVLVKEVSVIGPSTSLTSSPKDFEFQFSDDDIIYSSIKAYTGQTGWAASTARIFTF